MHLHPIKTKNTCLAPFKWEKARSGVSESEVGTSTASVSQFVIFNSSFLIDFTYNDRGQRLSKTSPSGTTHYVRDAAGSVLGIYFNQSLTEQPVYGNSRLGVRYRGSGKTAYQLSDHLGNVRAVVMENEGNAISITNKTDYYPFGMPMPNRQTTDGDYRYGYQGEFAETDKETGKPAFELRIYDPRLGRWLAPDPAHQYPSPYLAMGNNAISRIDPDGGEDDDYKLNQDGSLTLIAETDFADRIFNDAGDFVQLEYDGQIKIDQFGKLTEFLEFKDVDISTSVFEFLSYYSAVEWSQVIYNDISGYIGSSYNQGSTRAGSEILASLINNGKRGDFIKRHSHPRTIGQIAAKAAGLIDFDQTPSPEDIGVAKSFVDQINSAGIININIKHQVYDAVHGGYYNYNHRGFTKPININRTGISPFQFKF